MPVHLREDVVQESEHPGCLSSPVQLCRGYAVRAHSIDLSPVLDAGHLVFPVFLEHFYAPVRLGDIRLEDDEGFPLCRRLPRQGFSPAPPRAFRAWGGWGEWGPPIRALDRGERNVQAAGGLHHPPAPIRALGTWGQAGAVGVPLRALGTWGLPLHRLVNIPRFLIQWMAWRQSPTIGAVVFSSV